MLWQVCDIGEILSVRPNLTKDLDWGCFFYVYKSLILFVRCVVVILFVDLIMQ